MKKALVIAGALAVFAAAVFAARPFLVVDGSTEPARAPLSGKGADRRALPNLLLVTLDTTRADRLGCYGYGAALTPALDALAARGVVFEQAFTSSPMTLPAHTTMLTGLLPPEHGVRVNGKQQLAAAVPTLAELLSRSGYRTGAFVAAFVLDRKFGLDRGFEVYDDDLGGAYEQEVPESLSVYRPGSRVVDAALDWLGEVTAGRSSESAPAAASRAQPFFAWVHLYDPHWPYHLHPELAGTRLAGEESYDAEVAFVDRQVARLLGFLDERGLTSQTLVVAVADHGEGLEDHREIEHGYLLNEEVLRVPLIVALPGVTTAGHRVEAMVSLADLFPTVLDLLGLPAPALGHGRSLAPALHAETMPAVPTYAETDLPYASFGWSPLRSLTTPHWKYVRTPRPELFDRAADPGELFNLASARPAQLAEMEAQLAATEAGMTPGTAPTVALDAAERQRLASLGYVVTSAAPPPPADSPQLRDVKDMLPTKSLAAELRRGIATGSMDAAEILDVARQLVARSPETAVFHQHLGEALLAGGETGQAVEQLTEAVRLDSGSAETHYELAEALMQAGKREEATRHYREALRIDPGFAAAHVGMGNVLADRGWLAEAAGHYAEALRLRPAYPEAHYDLANTLARRGKVALAVEHYDAALRDRPGFAAAHYNLANLLRDQGRLDEAIAHYREAIRLEPDNPDAHNNLGVSLAEAGEPGKAKEQYLEALRITADFPRPHTNLGNLFSAQGECGPAIEHYTEAVRLRPEAPGPARRLAWVLATCADARFRDGKRAVSLAERAAAQTRRRDALVLDTLAAAYAEAGRFEQAVRTAKEALHLAGARRGEQLAADIQQRIDIYATHQPFREAMPRS